MKLGFYTLLSYDYKLAFASIKSYYNIADEIILAVDSARISFSGKPFEFDEQAVKEFIEKLDYNKKKIRFIQQPFFEADKSSLDNEVNVRNKISNLFAQDTYIIAINSDEILLNADEFWMWFSGQEITEDIEAISYTVYKQFSDRFLISEPFDKSVVGTAQKGQYRLHRATQSDIRIKSPLKILNNSFGRPKEEILLKLENCSYSEIINKDEFIKAWDAVSVENHASAEIVHPFGLKSAFKSLRLVPIERFGIKAEVKKEVVKSLKSDKYSIVCPIKDQYQIVKKCLESFERNCSEQEIILIDDGSTEEATIKMIVDMCKKNNWKYFRNEKSQGHTKASELGIKNSFYENVFLVNSDIIVPKKGLKHLADTLNQYEEIAVVGPSTSSASGPQQMQEAYSNRFIWTVQQIDDYANNIVDSGIIDLPLVNGFCFGIKKSVFVKIGGFDKALSCYGNEKELLVRIRKAGYRTVWVKESYIHHFGKMSYGQEKGLNIGQAQLDGDRYIIKKHGRLS